mmetsp:Transcript_36741/g.88319  ORF Transcript_36741/g.88319 Transcript_36741/m.88319 type:complete len:598 (-) Transcript_36741:91-1884(-)
MAASAADFSPSHRPSWFRRHSGDDAFCEPEILSEEGDEQQHGVQGPSAHPEVLSAAGDLCSVAAGSTSNRSAALGGPSSEAHPTDDPFSALLTTIDRISKSHVACLQAHRRSLEDLVTLHEEEMKELRSQISRHAVAVASPGKQGVVCHPTTEVKTEEGCPANVVASTNRREPLPISAPSADLSASGLDDMQKKNWMQRIVGDPRFDLGFGALIVVNACVMAFALEFEGEAIGDELGVGEQQSRAFWDSVSHIFSASAFAFALVFSLELLLRVCADGICAFRSGWNLLDLFAVIVAWIDFGVLPDPSDNMPNLNVARVFRFVRLTKVFRVVRLAGIFGELRLLIKTCIASILSLFWAMVLLFSAMIIASIFIGQIIQPVMRDESRDIAVRLEAFASFGTFSRCFITMFEITMAAGGWVRSGRFLTFQVDRRLFLFFFVYFLLVSFALIRVISAVFIKQTLQMAEKDHEQVVAEQARSNKALVARCKEAFTLADTSNDGTITAEELMAAAALPEVKAYLAANDLDVTEVPGVFSLLDSGNDGSLTFDEFVNGVSRLRGGAKQLDVASLMFETKRILVGISEMNRTVSQLQASLARPSH